MSARSCPRAWQAEALLDRRIVADDAASFERHVQTCSVCAHELRELARLKDLGQRLPWPKSEPLQRRRQRAELLKRAHGDDAEPTRWRWSWLVVAALCVLVLSGVVAERALRRQAPGPPNVSYEVLAGSRGAWREVQAGRDVRLQLREGEITVRIARLKAGQSFVLWLPDGELEVRGTVFTVELTSGHTSRVAVREGRVALRLAGHPELLLSAGQVWQAEPVVPPTSSPVVEPAPSAPSAESPRSTVSSRAAPSTTRPAAPAVSSAAPSPATDFALAMATFSRGDFASAEQLFQRFEARHPHSSQVEDSSFLRALSRKRRGDTGGAAALAAEYLRRYPNGFRASEAARLVEGP
jgi:TolA-binding protein